MPLRAGSNPETSRRSPGDVLLSAAKYLLFHADLAFPSTLAEPALLSADARLNAAATLSLGIVGYKNEINERGERLISLDHAVVARLRAMRGPGESYSDAILRLVASRA
jgi:hypothetical protein